MNPEIQKLVTAKCARIDADANSQKSAVEFIANILDKQKDSLAPFIPQDSQDSTQITSSLFSLVESSLREIERNATSSIRIIRRIILETNDPNTYKSPETALGWHELIPLNDGDPTDLGKYPFRIISTQEGLEVVNAYRQAQGIILSVQEQGAKNRETFWQTVRDSR